MNYKREDVIPYREQEFGERYKNKYGEVCTFFGKCLTTVIESTYWREKDSEGNSYLEVPHIKVESFEGYVYLKKSRIEEYVKEKMRSSKSLENVFEDFHRKSKATLISSLGADKGLDIEIENHEHVAFFEKRYSFSECEISIQIRIDRID